MRNDRQQIVHMIIELAVNESDDTNDAAALLIACAHSVLVTAGNDKLGALLGLHGVIDELSRVVVQVGADEREECARIVSRARREVPS